MNYCIVAFGIILIISVIQWIVDGRKNFKGPYIDPEVIEQGQVAGLVVGDSNVADHNGGSSNGEDAKRKAV